MKHLHLDTVDSTNTYVARHAADLESMTMVTARCQTGGRGQRGNTWESEPGSNLTFTLLWRPEAFAVHRQFAISRAVCLAVAETADRFGARASVKWPNDIYVGNKKIAGILIEHAVGPRHIMHTIIGVGLNVRQTRFVSDAPNPTSIALETGTMPSVDDVRIHLASRLEERLAEVQADPEANRPAYDALLWRADGRLHTFRDAASGLLFSARLDSVAADGMLKLTLPAGAERVYAFKEVAFIL